MKLPLTDSREALRGIGAIIGQYKWRTAMIIALQGAASIATVSIPAIVGMIIDGLAQGRDHAWLIMMLALAFAAVGIAFVMTWQATTQATIFGELIFHHMRTNLLRALTHLPLSIVEKAGAGDLLARTSDDLRHVAIMVRVGMFAMLAVIVSFTVTVVTAMATSWKLGLVTLAGIPVIILSIRWYMARVIPSYQAAANVHSVIAGYVAETVEQAESVDALRLARIRQGRIDAALVEQWRVERYGALMRVWLFSILVIGTLAPLLGVIALGVYLLPSGAVTAGQITTVTLLGYQMRGPIWEATFWLDELQFTLVALRRIFGVSTVSPDRQVRARGIEPGVINAESVSYEYEANRPVLCDVTLDLRAGERLAIVGPSGAGKSTLGRMLAGIHPPTSGTVTISGTPLVDLPEDELRRHVVLVTQEHHVFVGTLADNLRLALPAERSATDEELLAALQAVGAAGWVAALDKGLDTRVGAGGVELTPAQAQQLALARIIVMNPHTVVLDEATSLIDASDAENVERSLGALLRGRTVVAIAHRLHTAHDADRIAVMDQGRIVELGPHDELVALGGVYADLWEKWNRR